MQEVLKFKATSGDHSFQKFTFNITEAQTDAVFYSALLFAAISMTSSFDVVPNDVMRPWREQVAVFCDLTNNLRFYCKGITPALPLPHRRERVAVAVATSGLLHFESRAARDTEQQHPVPEEERGRSSHPVAPIAGFVTTATRCVWTDHWIQCALFLGQWFLTSFTYLTPFYQTRLSKLPPIQSMVLVS